MLANGSPTEKFMPIEGLRKSDPLAPFLFLIVAMGLLDMLPERNC